MSPERFSRNGTGLNDGNTSLLTRDRLVNETLANRYDRLSQLWAEAEKKLKALKPPHPVWIEYGHELMDPPEHSPQSWKLLALTKFNGNWRICHATNDSMNDSGSGSVFDLHPLVECSAQIRIEAVKHIRELHLAIVRAKEEYIHQADEAVKELAQAVSEI